MIKIENTYVNVDKILSVREDFGGVFILTTAKNHDFLFYKEPLESIIEKINQFKMNNKQKRI